MASSILREVRDGDEHADFSSQAGDDHAEDPGCNPGKLGAGMDGGGSGMVSMIGAERRGLRDHPGHDI